MYGLCECLLENCSLRGYAEHGGLAKRLRL